ncbi:GTPase-activating protein gyp3 [Purpureocillium lavendulum]|uniref:GTPase-activating protein gyp3 n=1 Tax=Purpureocillium lavendulum TaxID=1247861 RepID=A0AB34G2J9_9HYPO|nr:GTPase-activating protein gyp3 [Purpureocillium lavendulum]
MVENKDVGRSVTTRRTNRCTADAEDPKQTSKTTTATRAGAKQVAKLIIIRAAEEATQEGERGKAFPRSPCLKTARGLATARSPAIRATRAVDQHPGAETFELPSAMNSAMAVAPPDDARIERSRSGNNRQISLYASRIKPVVAPLALDLDRPNMAERTPRLPDLPPLPVSPRWDSLSNGAHLMNRSPTSSRASPSPYDVLPDAHPHQAIAPPMASPMGPGFGPIPSPRDALAGTPSPRSGSPPVPLTAKSSFADLRLADGSGGVVVENFSRPRKQSIRQPVAWPEYAAPSEPALPPLASRSPTHWLHEQGPQTTTTTTTTLPWQRPRRPSVSSCKSASTFSSPRPPVNAESSEFRVPRPRNATGPPLTGARPPFAPSRADGSAPPPGAGGAPPPWLAGDELRSSFRSQLTASSAPGTAATERSSVLTKDSSVASVYANDEPSLEDVMGMYEKGFADDEDDDNDYEYDQPGATDAIDTPDDADVDADARRPDSAVRDAVDAVELSTTPEEPGILVEEPADSDLEHSLPNVRSTLDAEIRQSKMIFTSPDFTSSVPAISGGVDTYAPEKRDSAKSLDSERPLPSALAFGISLTLPSPVPPPPSEPEDPGSRDRYGFKKQNQFVTRQQYDSWNKGYSQYLARRRKKWVAYLKDCALMTDRPIRFPPPNAKTKRFVRKGIPPDWRGAAWFYYAGGPAILAKHSGLYEKLLSTSAKQIDVEAIERDLHRTFPDNIQFKPSARFETSSNSDRASRSTTTGSTSGESGHRGPLGSEGEPPIITSLRRVLHAFAVYNPRIGYCQSLNFLAGLLLLFVETEEQCFWLLNVITIIYLPGTHEMSLEGSKVDLGVLMTELRDTMPAVWDKIGGELDGAPGPRPGTSKSLRKATIPLIKRRDHANLSTERLPPITLCMTAWFMSCYIGTLPIETTLRVWDVFFYEGSKTLFRIALAIFKTGESEIKAVSDPMEMFGVVQALPRRMLDANVLMETCFKRRNGFGHLSQGTIDERRQERRDKAHQEQAQQQRNRTGGGNLTEVDEPMVRKGTLFGKKRADVPMPRPAEV